MLHNTWLTMALSSPLRVSENSAPKDRLLDIQQVESIYDLNDIDKESTGKKNAPTNQGKLHMKQINLPRTQIMVSSSPIMLPGTKNQSEDNTSRYTFKVAINNRNTKKRSTNCVTAIHLKSQEIQLTPAVKKQSPTGKLYTNLLHPVLSCLKYFDNLCKINIRVNHSLAFLLIFSVLPDFTLYHTPHLNDISSVVLFDLDHLDSVHVDPDCQPCQTINHYERGKMEREYSENQRSSQQNNRTTECADKHTSVRVYLISYPNTYSNQNTRQIV